MEFTNNHLQLCIEKWLQYEPERCEKCFVKRAKRKTPHVKIVVDKEEKCIELDTLLITVMVSATARLLNFVLIPYNDKRGFVYEVRVLRGLEALGIGKKTIHPGLSALDAYVDYLWRIDQNPNYDSYSADKNVAKLAKN